MKVWHGRTTRKTFSCKASRLLTLRTENKEEKNCYSIYDHFNVCFIYHYLTISYMVMQTDKIIPFFLYTLNKKTLIKVMPAKVKSVDTTDMGWVRMD